MIGICLRIVDTSRVSALFAGSAVAFTWLIGWPQIALVVLMVWSVPIVLSGAVLLVVPLVAPEWVERWRER